MCPRRILPWLAVAGAAGCAQAGAATAVDGCTAEAVETAGHRALALVVGVGAYKSTTLQQLPGPANDARAIAGILTQRYGFPAQNVCTLLEEQATVAGFEAAWERTLVQRARPGDTAVFYFAGHGSQMTDDNGDEPSGWDQTLVLQDSRTGSVTDLRDDRLNQLLDRLYRKTSNVVVISDSCNSGSVTRGGAGRAIARTAPPPGLDTPASGFQAGTGKRWLPAHLPSLIALSAAADGTSALEIDGHGVFTDALVQVLNQPGPAPSYAQIARQVSGLMAARSPQVPYFQGKLSREVFNVSSLPRPVSWEVRSVSAGTIELAGAPTPGMGVNAELRVFDANARRDDYGDPTKSKAMLVVQKVSGFNATTRVATTRKGARPIAPGDLALLARPGDAAVQVSVRLRPAQEPGGIPPARAQTLRAAIARSSDASAAVIATEGPGAFELSALRDGRLQLRGLANEVRAVFKNDDDAVPVLWQLARQQALASLRGEGRPFFRDEESLAVELVPAGAADQGSCGARKIADFVPRAPGQPIQTIGLCAAYQVKVTLARDAGKPVIVGGVMLSGDGRTYGFPLDGTITELKPGQSYTFPEGFRAGPPIGVNDTLRVFGTLKTNPVAWHLLTDDARTRGPKPAPSPLHRALERYLVAGTRGLVLDEPETKEDTQWTASTVTLQVEANPRLTAFDVRPYLPDDTTSAVHRVLRVADRLARQKLPSKQHAWTAASFDANAKLGIDSSHAAMAAFTQAGLPYNKKDRYLPTAEMVAPQTPMSDYFTRCDAQAPQLGDLLVYRDDQRGDGWVAMVIDPQRRIGWASLGWDGHTAALTSEPANGVQFQSLRDRDDWKRLNRGAVAMKACWRYRQFAEEMRSGRGLPGLDALERDTCSPASCAGSP